MKADSPFGGIGFEIRGGVAELECHLTPPFFSRRGEERPHAARIDLVGTM
jgi:hypothetical protein